jgi:hypothetical protein
MKKTALALFAMTLLATFAYADDSDNSVNLTGTAVRERALQQDSEMGIPAGAEMPATTIKSDTKYQQTDAWTIRSFKENYNSRH